MAAGFHKSAEIRENSIEPPFVTFQVEFKEKLGTEKLKWHITRDKEMEQKIKDIKQQTIDEENVKYCNYVSALASPCHKIE